MCVCVGGGGTVHEFPLAYLNAVEFILLLKETFLSVHHVVCVDLEEVAGYKLPITQMKWFSYHNQWWKYLVVEVISVKVIQRPI